MALRDKVNTAKEVLSDSRSRMVVILLAIIVVVVLTIAFIKLKKSDVAPAGLGSAVTTTPGITSIPGLGQPTREYAKLQEQQNIELAEQAAREGTSAIPTVVRTTYLDTGYTSDLTGAESGAGCGAEELKRARAAGVTASELKCRGCSAAALKAAGFSAAELRNAGFSANELAAAGFSAAELRDAGFSAKDLMAAGFSAAQLKDAGFNAAELLAAGYTPDDLAAAGFTATEIKNAIDALGSCDAVKLQEARNKGVSAAELRKLGCSAAALKAAGYTAAELKAAGFSAGELRNAGFSAADLKQAGFSAAELKAAGFSAGELSAAGFTADDLLAAGYSKGDLARAGIAVPAADGETIVNPCSENNLKKYKSQGKSVTELRKFGCSAAALKAAGYTAAELKAAGFSAAELKAAGFSADDLSGAGFTADDLLDAGFKAETSATGEPADKPKVSTSNYSGLQSQIARMDEKEMEGMSAQEMKTFVSQQQALMLMQANKLFSAWTPGAAQQYVQGEPPDSEKNGAEKPLTAEEKQKEMLKNSDLYKAGTIIFAVLDTGVNSDETSPVMVTIVQGKLRGSKAIGNFQRVDKKVLLKFTVLSVPKLDTSISVNAVAIDPNTANTAMASDVDNHYMLRYGTLFASSFISGLGQAFQTAGGTTTATTTGTLTTMPALNAKEKAIVALGNVGQQFGTAMSSNVNMPPTVTVNAGTSLGLLLMADLAVPKTNQQNNNNK